MQEKKLFPFQEIKQKLVNFCVYQDRCHSDVEQKMKEFVLIPEAKEEIILYLIKENYLNEERFARSYTRGKFYIKKWGKNKIKQQLRLKGISDKLIAISFSEIDEHDYQDTIRDFIEKLLPTYNGLKDYQRKQKLIKFLMSKGYEFEMIQNELKS
ncbi:regulatory protein RecX [Cloacibacterium normanense]|uniref:regulatory protein RecX n=1 Tax=Cloacibacterium normanense TaxID=237258 RepID=UPI0035B24155